MPEVAEIPLLPTASSTAWRLSAVLIALAPLWVALAAMQFLLHNPAIAGLYLLLAMGWVAAAVSQASILLRNRAVAVTGGELVLRRSRGERRLPVAEVTGTFCWLVLRRSMPPVLALLLVGPDGRRIALLESRFWPAEGLTVLAWGLGLPPVESPTGLRMADLRQRHPRAVSWPLAHPVAFGLILVGAVLVVGIAALVVLLLALFPTG